MWRSVLHFYFNSLPGNWALILLSRLMRKWNELFNGLNGQTQTVYNIRKVCSLSNTTMSIIMQKIILILRYLFITLAIIFYHLPYPRPLKQPDEFCKVCSCFLQNWKMEISRRLKFTITVVSLRYAVGILKLSAFCRCVPDFCFYVKRVEFVYGNLFGLGHCNKRSQA